MMRRSSAPYLQHVNSLSQFHSEAIIFSVFDRCVTYKEGDDTTSRPKNHAQKMRPSPETAHLSIRFLYNHLDKPFHTPL